MVLRRPLRLLLVVIGLSLAATGVGRAAGDPAGFISELVNKALQALDNRALSNEDRVHQFRDLLERDFDIARIARFVLGRYWNEATDQERQQFQKLFEEYVVQGYAQRFSEYSGETVKITGSRPESETSTLVQSQIISPKGAPPAKVDWRVRKDDGGFKIVDVDVEGVSMVLTQREEFSAVIQRNGGLAGLNRELQQKLASGDFILNKPPPAAKN